MIERSSRALSAYSAAAGAHCLYVAYSQKCPPVYSVPTEPPLLSYSVGVWGGAPCHLVSRHLRTDVLRAVLARGASASGRRVGASWVHPAGGMPIALVRGRAARSRAAVHRALIHGIPGISVSGSLPRRRAERLAARRRRAAALIYSKDTLEHEGHRHE